MTTNLLDQIIQDLTALEELAENPSTTSNPSAQKPDEQVIQGPLALVYSQALQKEYSMTPLEASGDSLKLASESQAMDEMIAVQAQAQAVETLQSLIHGGQDGTIKIYESGSGVKASGDTTSVDPNNLDATTVFKDAMDYVDPNTLVNWVFVEKVGGPSGDNVSDQNSTAMLIEGDPKPSVAMEQLAIESITVLITTKKVAG